MIPAPGDSRLASCEAGVPPVLHLEAGNTGISAPIIGREEPLPWTPVPWKRLQGTKNPYLDRKG
jgi:hypothetical protein